MIKEVECLFNRAILFETNEKSWHGVESIKLPENARNMTRKSITVYMYTEDRPIEQVAPFHETVYLPGPMPKSIRVNQTILNDEYNEITSYINGARNLVAGLYRHQQKLLQRIRNMRSVLASYERNYYPPVFGDGDGDDEE